MNTDMMTVTDAERELIMKLRKADEEKRNHVHVLEVAHRFAAWLQEYEAGATYSTFCDDFGYASRKGEDRPRLYDCVLEVIRTARNC